MESSLLYRGGVTMASTGLEKEVIHALQCIKDGKNFILEGGAGSGKTYSLIQLIETLIIENPDIRIVCITYTNNAVSEILSRIDSANLWVSTIHEFIWSVIKKYQIEIKKILQELINDESIKRFKKPKGFEEDDITEDYFENIYVDYDEYYSMTPNNEDRIKISHDHILVVAEKMFSEYKKLSDILKDIADCIFVDEYQDTNPLIATILLKHLEQSSKKNVIGFFGDSMQAIYDNGIGNLNQYSLTKIIKTQNRRNPRTIIEIANKFRNDNMVQFPSEDISAPNMENGTIIEGSVKFLYGKELGDFNNIKDHPIFIDWDFSDSKKTKKLMLTHRYNAEMIGFKDLFNLYNKYNRESLMSYKLNSANGRYEAGSHRDRILQRLDIVEEIIFLYTSGRFNDFLKKTNFSINNNDDKVFLKNTIEYLTDSSDKTIEDVLNFSEEKGLLKTDDLFNEYISNRDAHLWEKLKKLPFAQYRKSISYLKEFSPNCTQHSVKGSEYDNVFLILESNWNEYDFKTLFGKGSSNPNVQTRTKKLFYVCITRAKRNLVIYMPTDDIDIITPAKEIFGEDNTICI